MWWTIILIVIGVIFITGACVLALGRLSFKRKTRSEVTELLMSARQADTGKIISEEDIRGLPEPVRRYLRYTGTIGKEYIACARLKQKGSFRQGDRPWMPFEAEQYYITDNPGFIWIVDMKAFPLISVKGRDMYYHGKGNMLIRIPPFVTIADARGDEINQGTLVRYLNEIMWFPTSYLNDYIEWEPIDSKSTRATISYGGTSASAVLYFDEEGRMTNFEAKRYYTEGDKVSPLETWTTPIKEYGNINGMRLPTKGEGVWKLKSGDFPYIRLEIVDIEYNNPAPY